MVCVCTGKFYCGAHACIDGISFYIPTHCSGRSIRNCMPVQSTSPFSSSLYRSYCRISRISPCLYVKTCAVEWIANSSSIIALELRESCIYAEWRAVRRNPIFGAALRRERPTTACMHASIDLTWIVNTLMTYCFRTDLVSSQATKDLASWRSRKVPADPPRRIQSTDRPT